MEPTPRFDLEQAVSAWRQELAQQRGPAAKDVRELEAHLRDAFAALKKFDLSDEEAFMVAWHRVGPPTAVAEEYAKEIFPPLWRTRLFWYAFLLVFVGVAGWMFSRPAEYMADASLRMVKSSNGEPAGPEEFNTRIHIAETWNVASEVAQMMTPEQRMAFVAPFPDADDPDAKANLVNRLLAQRFVAPGRLAYILQFGVEHPDKKLVAVVADDFAQAFMNQEKIRDPDQQYQWLDHASSQIIQSEPKPAQILFSGFFLGLGSAIIITMLTRLISQLRRPPPTPSAEAV